MRLCFAPLFQATVYPQLSVKARIHPVSAGGGRIKGGLKLQQLLINRKSSKTVFTLRSPPPNPRQRGRAWRPGSRKLIAGLNENR